MLFFVVFIYFTPSFVTHPLFFFETCFGVAASVEIVVVIVAPFDITVVVIVHAVSNCLFICRSSKKLNTGGC